MKIINNAITTQGLKTLFEQRSEALDFTFGTVTIQPGERVPKEGLSVHEENEYSLIINGSIEGESGGEKYQSTKGEATFIPAKEKHWAINNSNEPCEIVWVLVKEN